MDCSNLGIMMSNKPAAPTPVMAGNGMNQGEAVNEDCIRLFIILLLFAISLGRENYMGMPSFSA